MPRTPRPTSEPESTDALELSGARVRSIRQALRAWFLREARDLPWRRTRDPYRIWLSEAMLQQTRVETVIPYYERFVARFPTVESLADADEADVLREWAGLGYYSRARNLKRAAQIVVRDHGGRLPADEDALRGLPGIGRYTVGAIRSIAFRERAPLVDGNVTRVLARWLARPDPTPEELWGVAAALVPDERPDIFNQALMELGATCCTPRAPRCGGCPVAGQCAAHALGLPESYPAPRKRPAPRPLHALGAVLEHGTRPRRLLVVRRPSRGLLGGLWEIPSAETRDPQELVAHVAGRSGLPLRAGGELGAVRHLFSHRDLRLRLVRVELAGHPRRRPSLADGAMRWCSPAELRELPLSRLVQKVLAEIEASRGRLL